MLDTDKIYSPTPYKLKELRDKGIVPYSKTAQTALNCAITLCFCYLLLPDISEETFALPNFLSSSVLDSNFIDDSSKRLIFFLFKLSSIMFICSLTTRLFNSGFLLLSLGRYPFGILQKSSNSKSSSGYLTIFGIQLTIIGATLIFLYFSYLSFFKTGVLTDMILLPIGSQTVIPSIITPKYFILVMILLSSFSVWLMIKQRFSFLEQQRMSKDEILLEIKETEGSQETKKQIRSAN